MNCIDLIAFMFMITTVLITFTFLMDLVYSFYYDTELVISYTLITIIGMFAPDHL